MCISPITKSKHALNILVPLFSKITVGFAVLLILSWGANSGFFFILFLFICARSSLLHRLFYGCGEQGLL